VAGGLADGGQLAVLSWQISAAAEAMADEGSLQK